MKAEKVASADEGLRVIELNVEHFCRVVVARVRPEDDVMEVRGGNEDGKTSLIDAIWAALGGEDFIPEEPIQRTQTYASIYCDLGDYIVERKFTDGVDKSRLEVRDKYGNKIAKPQTVLDSLLGRISFDPLAFAEMKPVPQAKLLAEVCGIDFDHLQQRRSEIFTERTAANRELESAKNRLQHSMRECEGLDENQFSEELSISDLNAQYLEAQNRKDAKAKAMTELARVDEKIASLDQETQKVRDQIAHLQERLVLLDGERALQEGQKKAAEESVDRTTAALIDTADLIAKIQSAEEHNANVRKFDAVRACRMELDIAKGNSDQLTRAIEAIDEEKQRMIAEAELPIDQLRFDEKGVTYHDLPFDQCGTSQKIKVSCALAMRMNPKIRILRIARGESLDSKSMKLLRQIAKKENFQIWVERVTDSKEGAGLFIEEGQIAKYQPRSEDD